MIKGNIDIEKTSFKTFLVFSFFLLAILLPSYLIFSSKYMVRNVEFSPKYQVDSSFLETLYGESIWTLDETSVESLYSSDPTIEKIELTKILPSKLEIKLKLYEQVAEISD
ncbi:MAG: FtsQ-type POTRA domain-containing protein, partial [Candidatus Actinomarina sp.]